MKNRETCLPALLRRSSAKAQQEGEKRESENVVNALFFK
jgi:hypothetical protein